MSETYYAGAYWRARKESPEECGRRAEVFLTALSKVDPSFSQWFKQGNSRKEALKHRIELDRASLEKMFRRGMDRVVEELGFRISGWTGGDDYEASSFFITCGGHSEHVRNVCLIHLPSQGSGHLGPIGERVLTAVVLTELVRAMAVAWEPDHAVANSSELSDLIQKDSKEDVVVSWVMYLSHCRGKVPPLPAPVRVEPVEDKGTLIVLTPERFTVNNPEHVALAARVRDLLDEAGLLGRRPS